MANILLNCFTNIERHRKIKFNQEIKNIVKDIIKELYSQNKKLINYKNFP